MSIEEMLTFILLNLFVYLAYIYFNKQ